MFNYITLVFPTVKVVVPPERLYKFTMQSESYAHEVAVVSFRDWDIPYEALVPGTPVECQIKSTSGYRSFYSYIHHINPRITPGSKITDMFLIGSSYVLKQANQRIFMNMTADAIVKQIGKENSFAVEAEPHPRVYEQVAQAGHTDLEIMVRLAKQCGYTLRIKDSTIFFEPQTIDFGVLKPKAQTFVMRDPNDPAGSTLYSFDLVIGDSIYYKDSMKAAVAVSGVDANSAAATKAVSAKRPTTIRTDKTSEVFDRYATDIVAPSFDVAYYEAIAADLRNRFPYRARVEVIGSPEIRPDMPVYIDGVGPKYSGYWIVLSAQQRVVEYELNNMRYTTVLEIGADSLGSASVWEDGTVQPYPNPKKKIITDPKKQRTRKKDRTVLKK